MKKFIYLVSTLVCLFSAGVPAFSQVEVSYALPRTSIILDVTASQDVFHSGPFAKYAAKYFGVAAKETDDSKVEISSVKMCTATESDTVRFKTVVSESAADKILALTSQGLVSSISSDAPGEWRFKASENGDFSGKGLPSNLEYGSKSKNVQEESAIMQNVVVEKSLEKKAKEISDRIFAIRENRYNILIGNTDATYSGEAMKSAIDELTRMEKELMTLFYGYSETHEMKAVFEVVPSASAPRQMYVAFRVSDTDGLVSPDNVSGRPFFLELTPETKSEPFDFDSVKNKKSCVFYRLPAVCKAVLSDGGNPLLDTRVPVYQLGQTDYFNLK